MQPTADTLYTVAQVRELDRRAIAALGGDGYALMSRAGEAAFRRLRARWPSARRVVIACGTGNNGGDGYIVARLARGQGLDAVVVTGDASEPRSDDARRARNDWLAAGGTERVLEAGVLPASDLVVDGVLGIGLTRAPEGAARALIDAIAAARRPVLALDLPSGLDADSGQAPGACVRADLTVTFIARKRGSATGDAPAHVGDLVLEPLDVAATCFDGIAPDARLVGHAEAARALAPRARTAHKGHFGHVLVIGGDHGMAGAARLAAEAAARTGAGLVSVATRREHAAAIVAARPELMVRGVESAAELEPQIARANALAIGPGLGQSGWARELLAAALARALPTVVDADALNLLALHRMALPARCVLTPHPGEAARMLGSDTGAIQKDRFAAARTLAREYGAVTVLKGAGTLIAEPGGATRVLPAANPGMASGGMGDVLTGVIASLLAQGLAAPVAAATGAWLHAEAARRAAVNGERGMLASDVLAELRGATNP
jgi:NAD(P)H-hydrate epimerase